MADLDLNSENIDDNIDELFDDSGSVEDTNDAGEPEDETEPVDESAAEEMRELGIEDDDEEASDDDSSAESEEGEDDSERQDEGSEEEAEEEEPEENESEEEAEEEESEEESEDESEEPEEEAEEESEKEEQQDSLPDGVTVRTNDKGKKEWVYSEDRGRSIYADKKQADLAKQVFGEESLTQEGLEVRQNAYMAQQMMLEDFQSPDAAEQANILHHFIIRSKEAREAGELGHDPVPSALIAFAEQAEQEAPDAAAALEKHVVSRMISRLYAQNAKDARLNEEENDLRRNRFNAAGVLDNLLTGQYKDFDSYQPPADIPPERRTQTNNTQSPKEEIQSRIAAFDQKAEPEIGRRVAEVIDTTLDRALGPKAKKLFRQKYPERLEDIKLRLREEVKKAIRTDERWVQSNRILRGRAGNAPRESVREDLLNQLVNRYGSKARTAIGDLARKIVAEDAEHIRASIKAKRKRLQGAQGKRRVPTGKPVQPKVPRKPKGPASFEDWEKAVDAM